MHRADIQKITLDPKPMSDSDFRHLSDFIYKKCGIKMPPVKKTMLEARLQKRLRILGLPSYKEYCLYLFDSRRGGEEYIEMIDCVTTNKTDFFREPEHFRFLADTVASEFPTDDSPARPLAVWSAACSSGEEPYTIAMVLSEIALQRPAFRFGVTATDISTKVLKKACAGVYEEESANAIPLHMKQRYLLRGKDRLKRLVKIGPELRAKVRFQRANLMEEHIMPPESMDVIFCRNVMIYFDHDTQYGVLARLCGYLRSFGYLFLGHSETMLGFDLPLRRVTSTVYRKTE